MLLTDQYVAYKMAIKITSDGKAEEKGCTNKLQLGVF